MAHDPKKVPDPSAGCPRCHYWEQTAEKREPRRGDANAWPQGIDQAKAADILTKAFPQKQYSR